MKVDTLLKLPVTASTGVIGPEVVGDGQATSIEQVSTDSYKAAFYPESRFGGFTDVDGTVIFYSRIGALVRPCFVVVDCGCGRGSHSEDPSAFRRNLRCFKGKVSKVIGLDVDASAAENQTIDEFRQLVPGRPWPLENQSADLITVTL